MNYFHFPKIKKNFQKLKRPGGKASFKLMLLDVPNALNIPKLPGIKKLNLLRNLTNGVTLLKGFSRGLILLLMLKNLNIMNNLISILKQ